MTEETTTNETQLRQSLKQRLEAELGIPLTPKTKTQIEINFQDNVILTDFYPINSITELKIGNRTVTSYTLHEEEGTIYLEENYNGKLYLKYTYCLPEAEYFPILDLMEAEEQDTSFSKNASSINENNVTVSYDTSNNRANLIQSMITDLKNRYNCTVRMI